MKEILKKNHKNLMIIEACFLYNNRYNLNLTEEEIILSVVGEDDGEIDRICKDLRFYRYYEYYKLEEITEEEYDLVCKEFNK